MIQPAPTTLPGQPCLIRIAARYAYRDFALFGGEVNYLGACFKVERGEIESLDQREHMATLLLNGRIIRSTGLASFLVDYKGHSLRVHVQQIRLLDEIAEEVLP